MARIVVASFVVLLLLSAPSVDAKKTEPRRRPSRIAAETLQPGSPFDCDTPRGSAWFGSTARCLAELCRGSNVTNGAVVGGDGRLRANPCVRRIDDRGR